MRLLHEPTTLGCGHTFCSTCLQFTEAEGRLSCCPLCRASLAPGALAALGPNVLLGTLLEKFLPEATAKRRAEVALEREADRSRHAVPQTFAMRVAALEGGRMAVLVQVQSLSRCPMHAGAAIPVGFFVARAAASFPEGWSPRERVELSWPELQWELSSLPPQQAALFSEEDLPSMSVRGLRNALDERGIGHKHCLEREELVELLRAALPPPGAATSEAPDGEPVVDVVLHFQPRFQLAPMSRRLALRDGEGAVVTAEFDSRVIHR